jgi:hypothetical protein
MSTPEHAERAAGAARDPAQIKKLRRAITWAAKWLVAGDSLVRFKLWRGPAVSYSACCQGWIACSDGKTTGAP